MPELAEVEFFRRQWDAGVGGKVARVHVGAKGRVFRGADRAAIEAGLAGATLLESKGHGKRMLFRFSGDAWLGIHLGMTGKLSVEGREFVPGNHDHLALFQKGRTLAFHDPRQFGRIQFHVGDGQPGWWPRAPQPHEAGFTKGVALAFLGRRRKAPIKAALLMQEGFPGIGNWMADEVLWRAGLDPRRRVGSLEEAEAVELWKQARWVSRGALKHIAPDHGDPPKGWLYHERGGKGGVCPRDGTALARAEVGGRTTAWCPQCQPGRTTAGR